MDMNSKEMINDFLKGAVNAQNIITDKLKLKVWDMYQQDMKALAEHVVSYNDDIWKATLSSIIGVDTREKFTQNNDLKESLIACKRKLMVFATPTDKLLGVGLNKEEVLNTPEANWPGENLLGTTLTTFRNTYLLKNNKKNTPNH